MDDSKVTLLSSEWLTTGETMHALGKANRTVREWAQKGRLRWKLGLRNGIAQRHYYAPDVEQYRPALPKPSSVPRLRRRAPAELAVARQQSAPVLAAPAPLGLFLTLEQASLYAGLTIGFLRKTIGESKLFALRGGERGTWVISRASLDSFAGRRRFR